MKQFLFALIIGFFVVGPLLAQDSDSSATPSIGVNLGNSPFLFVDAMRSANDWMPVSKDVPLQLDENGWPTTDAKILVFDARPFGTWWGPGKTDDPKADSRT